MTTKPKKKTDLQLAIEYFEARGCRATCDNDDDTIRFGTAKYFTKNQFLMRYDAFLADEKEFKNNTGFAGEISLCQTSLRPRMDGIEYQNFGMATRFLTGKTTMEDRLWFIKDKLAKIELQSPFNLCTWLSEETILTLLEQLYEKVKKLHTFS